MSFGPYSPENCRWATRREQNNNTRVNQWYTINGERLTIGQWATRTGINYETLRTRLKVLGWSPEKAISQPVRDY